MSDYAKIADALRFTASEITNCNMVALSMRTLVDGAVAIEELMAQVRDKDYLIQQQMDEIERLRRDVKKQQDKMFELAKTRELKEMDTVKTWCHQRGIAMVDWPIYQSMVACYGRKPKRGEWEQVEVIGYDGNSMNDDAARCSVCGHVEQSVYWARTYYHYCPNCGAEMERPDEA